MLHKGKASFDSTIFEPLGHGKRLPLFDNPKNPLIQTMPSPSMFGLSELYYIFVPCQS